MYLKKAEREEVMNTIRVVMKEIYKTPKYYEENDEILTAVQVSELFPCFTKDWLRRYGKYIPRERVLQWADETCKDKYGYSRILLQELLYKGKINLINPIPCIL